MTTPAATASKPAGVWEDFVDIFYTPSTVFERRRAGRFGLALVILCVLFAAAFLAARPAIQPALDAQMDRAIEQMRSNPDIPADRMAGMEAATRRMGGTMFTATTMIMVPIAVALTALGLWLLGKLFDSKQTYRQAMMVSTYANVPRVVGTLLGGLAAFFTPAEQMTSMFRVGVTAARFAPADTPPAILGLLARIDPFVIWTTILLAIGLRITGGVSKRASYIVAAILFVLGTLFAVSGAMRGG